MTKEQAETQPKPKRKKSLAYRLVKYLFLLAVAFCALPLVAMIFFGLWSEPKHADAILVPGAALRDGGNSLSEILEERMTNAVELYREGYAPIIYLSGGGEGNWSEPHAMKRFAIERGVPESALVLDNEGFTTRATAENFKKYAEEKGIESVVVSTQFHHMPRVRLALKQAGVESSAASGKLMHAKTIVRETIALWAYAFRLEEHRHHWKGLRERLDF